MKYRLLGKSGLRVSEAALGTMTFGDEWGWGSPKAEAQKVYETYREAGGNFIDTANFYTNGTSERFMGEFIQGHRESQMPCLSSKLASRYLITALTWGSLAGTPKSVRRPRAFIAPRGEEPHQRVSLSRQEANPPSLFWNFANSAITASRLPWAK
jgi:aryl-alcohol dehydrogenase-like predicted oxidoreductase